MFLFCDESIKAPTSLRHPLLSNKMLKSQEVTMMAIFEIIVDISLMARYRATENSKQGMLLINNDGQSAGAGNQFKGLNIDGQFINAAFEGCDSWFILSKAEMYSVPPPISLNDEGALACKLVMVTSGLGCPAPVACQRLWPDSIHLTFHKPGSGDD